MKGDEKVIEYLNKALGSELTAGSRYWLHYRLQQDWGYGRLAKKSREESIEEMSHVDTLIDRIIVLGGHPNLQHFDPLRIGENVRETMECDLAGEHDARTLYIDARNHCDDACCSSVAPVETARAHGDLTSTPMDHGSLPRPSETRHSRPRHAMETHMCKQRQQARGERSTP